MKSYKDIINQFKTIKQVSISLDKKIVQVTGRDLEGREVQAHFSYKHSTVARKVKEKVSYFIMKGI